ncbi:hypothetical protein [Lentilactobacillus hilgardii]|nr:hypothetical protein [Lentilactobacillus hilgardii]
MIKKQVYRITVWEDDDPKKARLGNISLALNNFFYRHGLKCVIKRLQK